MKPLHPYLDVGVLGAHVGVGQLWEVPQVQDEGLRVLLGFRQGENTRGPAVSGPGEGRTRGKGLQQVLLLELLESLEISAMRLCFHLTGRQM